MPIEQLDIFGKESLKEARMRRAMGKMVAKEKKEDEKMNLGIELRMEDPDERELYKGQIIISSGKKKKEFTFTVLKSFSSDDKLIFFIEKDGRNIDNKSDIFFLLKEIIYKKIKRENGQPLGEIHHEDITIEKQTGLARDLKAFLS